MSKTKRIKIKICLVGDPAVGKTSLVQKFVYNLFSDSYMRTMGTKVSRKVINFHDLGAGIDYEITMMLWDIMGQQFQSMPMGKYFKMANGAMIVSDLTREDTFKNLKKWKEQLMKDSGDIPIIYLANKKDLTDQYAYSIAEFDDHCKKENTEYFLTSAKTGENVDMAFNRLGELVVSKFHGTKQKSKEQLGQTKRSPVMEQIEEIFQQTVKRQPEKLKSETDQISKAVSEIESGLGYIIKEEKPFKSFMIFKQMIKDDIKGLCISRIHPKRLEEDFQVDKTQVEIYWLSAESIKQENILAPTFLPQINTIIIEFIDKYADSVILLEGIEYLIEKNDFKTILNLIHSLNDHIMNSNARLLIPIDPLILKEPEIRMLSKDLKIL